ncbi:MAG: ligase-associated DNA damage response endonuclease PdeM [Hyphomicrobiales bacterium]|nr:ligase-associated DNA damage response endonuclease PdeM [Hyphomicrobiales bacterium]
MQPSAKAEERAGLDIAVGGETVTLDGRGVAWLPGHGALLAADLHLEKGSRLATMRRPAPRLDTHDTLMRLAACVRDYRPALVVCLGDSFHDGGAGERLSPEDAAVMRRLCASVPRWVWITGNHDPNPPECAGGEAADSLRLGALTLTHVPTTIDAPHVAGHLHPKATVSVRRQKITGRCFVSDGRLLVMPAFGAFAGGLSWKDEAFAAIYPRSAPECYMMFQEKLFRLPVL